MAPGRLSPPSPLLGPFLAGLLAALWAASLVPLVSVAAANERLVEAFATDEAMQLNLLHRAASNNTFALTFGPYGHLVFNVVLLVLRVIPGPLSDARIVHTGRAVSMVFGAAALWLTFIWTRRAFGEVAAWVALAALLVNPTLYTAAVVLKPDMAQLFFLMLALALTCRLAEEPRLRWLVLASGAAGLAFACKYSGLFVLPVIAGVSARHRLASGPRDGVDVRTAVMRLLAAALAVLLLAASARLNAGWIATHLTEDGRIDAAIAPHTLTLLSMAARLLALAVAILTVTPWLWSALRRRPQLLAVLWSWGAAAVAFAAAFVMASPYSLRRAAFLKGLFVEASDTAAPLSAAWLSTWTQGIATAVQWPILVAALMTIAGLAWRAASGRGRPGAAESIVMAWLALYALVLFAPIHELYVHYALPLTPPAAMLAARGAVAAAAWLARLAARRRLVPAVSAALVVATMVQSGRDLLAARARLVNRESTSDAVFVGRWLECRVPDSTRIAYDYFSYVPPVFQDASPTWGGTRTWLSSLDPDIVIVNRVTASSVMDEAAHAEYYQCLAGARCGYEGMLSRGTFTVYARAGQADELRARAPAPRPGCL